MNKLAERILENSIPEPNTGCWLWLGGRSTSSDNSYGLMSVDGKTCKAHRISYETFRGLIPLNHDVCHTCDFPPCVNPDHLFTGTRYANVLDRDKKKRRKAPKGEMNGFAKLTEDKVREIKYALDRQIFTRETQQDIADRYDIDNTTVSCIKTGKLWKHVLLKAV